MAVSFPTKTGQLDNAITAKMSMSNINLANVTASGATFSIPSFYGTLGIGCYNTKYWDVTYAEGDMWGDVYIGNKDVGDFGFRIAKRKLSVTSGWTEVNTTASTSAVNNLSTSNFFNSSNKTTKTLAITLKNAYMRVNTYGGTSGNIGMYSDFVGSNVAASGSTTLTLNAPPTFDVGTLTFDTPNWIYAGLTTASINISNLSAKYGGDITKAILKIGTQESVARTTDGVLSMLLAVVGENLPVSVIVTDSRGQTTTHNLGTVTVEGYNNPSVNLSVERTLNTGVPADEGTFAIVSAQFTFTDEIATLEEPTVTGGTSVTWYKTRDAQTGAIDTTSAVDWNDTSDISTGDTLYALIGTFQPNESYVISVTPIDSEGTGTTMSVTLPTAFYTIDFLAGGHGIAFGKPAETQDLFECDLNAQFNKQVLAPDYFMEIDTTDPPDPTTIDGKIYQALLDLGWDNDVIV